ncbi:unnamed protein product [marine sediment metagenome]|uniref:Uncharacterized protein n=1 Tax=marine sediment metagenome TaxID=412755 RepID=X0S7C3_9ZZZZ
MNTFVIIIKILPWVLSGIGGAGIWLSIKKIKGFIVKIKLRDESIKNLKDVVLSQGEEIAKQTALIKEMVSVQKKYEKLQGKIKGARSATKIMEDLHNG